MEKASSLTSDTVSSQKSLPSSHDPGWNDPPEWALSSQRTTCGTSAKRILNKRVAFPLSSQTCASGKAAHPLSPSSMPPVSQSSLTMTTAPHKPFATPIDRDYAARPSGSDFDKDEALTGVLANLESVITEQRMENGKVEEIRKRLDTMKTDWHEGKLNDAVQRSILDMSKALSRKDVEQADKIHVDLMMQHATVCRTWMPAIRHIILELRKKCERYSVSQPEHSQSPLLPVETNPGK